MELKFKAIEKISIRGLQQPIDKDSMMNSISLVAVMLIYVSPSRVISPKSYLLMKNYVIRLAYINPHETNIVHFKGG